VWAYNDKNNSGARITARALVAVVVNNSTDKETPVILSWGRRRQACHEVTLSS
jgi:hypothetical protein